MATRRKVIIIAGDSVFDDQHWLSRPNRSTVVEVRARVPKDVVVVNLAVE